MIAIKEENVANVFDNYPEAYRQPLLALRQLILVTANNMPVVGEIEESLKWNQPTYSTKVTKSGTPIRIDRFGADKIALFVSCQTTLIEEFKELFKEELEFSKTRAIVLDPKKVLPTKALSFCIEMALTYHIRKKDKN
ncbi:DUF1801 domain-containing protein [Isobaculum melis]|uniref:YdhG-like domain-containing protein n=1 Tax=Isobaculum melis TaxID=142588 RepID=A0A1H9TGG9_9LACT|nr:DUF1801 domain-containing protein [Isobaculum melis]SER96302.1 protein of unknown function (DU1801) [Isobaculum melis]